MKRIVGWLGTLCYKLQNHYLLGVSLRNWLWLWVLGPLVLSAFGRLPWTRAILVSVSAGLAWTGIEDRDPTDPGGRTDRRVGLWTVPSREESEIRGQRTGSVLVRPQPRAHRDGTRAADPVFPAGDIGTE